MIVEAKETSKGRWTAETPKKTTRAARKEEAIGASKQQ